MLGQTFYYLTGFPCLPSRQIWFVYIFLMNSSSVADSRESARHYIPASKSDIREMLQAVGHASFEDLFAHIDPDVLFTEAPDLPEELDPEALRARLQEIAERNRIGNSFLGDGLLDLAPAEVVGPL